jgi:hypothetical protein
MGDEGDDDEAEYFEALSSDDEEGGDDDDDEVAALHADRPRKKKARSDDSAAVTPGQRAKTSPTTGELSKAPASARQRSAARTPPPGAEGDQFDSAFASIAVTLAAGAATDAKRLELEAVRHAEQHATNLSMQQAQADQAKSLAALLTAQQKAQEKATETAMLLQSKRDVEEAEYRRKQAENEHAKILLKKEELEFKKTQAADDAELKKMNLQVMQAMVAALAAKQ